jgi:hypothetical protein
MSTETYPLSGIGTCRVTPLNRVVTDEMESGVTYARRLWAAQTFRRQFALSHGALTRAELARLQEFHGDRDGGYEAFYYRDNISREGHSEVRFANTPVWDASTMDLRNVDVTLLEIAPRRRLPTVTEVATAAGTTPLLWWDANRETAIRHDGAWSYDGDGLWDAVSAGHVGTWQAGSIGFGASLAEDYQHFRADGTAWAKGASNVALSGAQPACTLFAFVRHSTVSAKQVLFAVGTAGAGASLGLVVASDNRYEPWVGGTETWTNARSINSAADTWRSVAVVWTGASNNATLYVNAASIGTDAVIRSLTAGPATLFGSSAGTLLSGSSLAKADVAHSLVIPAALTLAQVKATHNLLCYQLGVATVA